MSKKQIWLGEPERRLLCQVMDFAVSYIDGRLETKPGYDGSKMIERLALTYTKAELLTIKEKVGA